MGRLFWKIFFAFWLAQLAAGAGTGTLVWLHHKTLAQAERRAQPHRPADPLFQAAEAVLKHGGVDALRGFLQGRALEPGPTLYVLDASGHELLGRPVPDSEGGPVVRDTDSPMSGDNPRFAEITTENGQTYRFLMSRRGLPFEGPPPPGGFPAGESPGMPPPGPPPPMFLIATGLLASLLFSAWLAWY